MRTLLCESALANEHGMFLLTMRPQYSGHRSRIVALSELIRYLHSKRKGWFATYLRAGLI